MTNDTFDYQDINQIVNSIKVLSDEEIDKLVEVSVQNNLTEDPIGLKQTFLNIRSGTV